MLKFWFIESLVLAPGSWQTEPWFAGVECYRRYDEAQLQLELRLDHYRYLATANRAEALERWNAQFGGHAPPMPESVTVCRIVEAKGQERKVGEVVLRRFRRARALLGRARWTQGVKTLYLVAHEDETSGGRAYLSRPEWPRLPHGMIGYRTQREAIERAANAARMQLTVLRVDASLTERLRRTTADPS